MKKSLGAIKIFSLFLSTSASKPGNSAREMEVQIMARIPSIMTWKISIFIASKQIEVPNAPPKCRHPQGADCAFRVIQPSGLKESCGQPQLRLVRRSGNAQRGQTGYVSAEIVTSNTSFPPVLSFLPTIFLHPCIAETLFSTMRLRSGRWQL
jgi:hypothetical protein